MPAKKRRSAETSVGRAVSQLVHRVNLLIRESNAQADALARLHRRHLDLLGLFYELGERVEGLERQREWVADCMRPSEN